MGLFDGIKTTQKPKEEPAVTPPPQLSVLARLQAIGDKKEINPPLTVPDPVIAASSPATSPTRGGDVCPYCRGQYKHLAKHKCKQWPGAEPTSAIEETKPPVEETNASADDTSEAEPEVASADEQEVEADEKYKGFDLYLDAIFERNRDEVEVHYFSEIIAPIAAQVAKENKTRHWATVEYARGGGFLAAMLDAWLGLAKLGGVVLADSFTPECKVCREVLKRHARSIVQGVR